jgi:large subunit ribosomal protein L30
MIKITLTSGLVAKKTTQRLVVEALGLKKYGSSVVHADSPTIRGMCKKVHHLVTVVPADKAEIEAKAQAHKATADAAKAAKKPAKATAAAK